MEVIVVMFYAMIAGGAFLAGVLIGAGILGVYVLDGERLKFVVLGTAIVMAAVTIWAMTTGV